MNFPIHEGCRIPKATSFIKTNNAGGFVFYDLDAKTPVPSTGERPPHCEDCTKCMPTVERGKSIGLSTYEITPETVNK